MTMETSDLLLDNGNMAFGGNHLKSCQQQFKREMSDELAIPCRRFGDGDVD
jgi:hypothetical protein